MTSAAQLIREEIRRDGPIAFSRFMEIAQYHPEVGYYRTRDPFGMRGDFYTAEQIQPVFGRLIARYLRTFSPATVVELGAGRREMADAFGEFGYIPVELGETMPESFSGAVFANEFFDALPADVVRFDGKGLREWRVDTIANEFRWVEGPVAGEAMAGYAREYLPDLFAGQTIEINQNALRWMDRIGERLSGLVVIIDYGYTSAETRRFPAGTLLSYHRHAALEDVLSAPGERDITAHVCFTALERHPRFERVTFESLAQFILSVGTGDEFASILAGANEAQRERHRLQLKTLLVGLGETFRVLVLRTK